MIVGLIKDKFKLAMILFVLSVCGLAYIQYQKIIELSSALTTQENTLKEQSKAIDKAVNDMNEIVKRNAIADKELTRIQENFKKQAESINQLRGGKLNDIASKDKTLVESGINATVNSIMQSISETSGSKNN